MPQIIASSIVDTTPTVKPIHGNSAPIVSLRLPKLSNLNPFIFRGGHPVEFNLKHLLLLKIDFFEIKKMLFRNRKEKTFNNIKI